MHRSKLLEIIRVFDKETLVDCLQFLQSPYLQSRSSQDYNLKLFEWIVKSAPKFENKRLTKSVTFNAIFPNKEYQVGRLEKIMSSLTKTIHRFIAYQEIRKEEDQVEFRLKQTVFFRNQNLEKFYLKMIDGINREQQGKKALDEDHYINQYLIQKELSFYASLHNSRTEALNIPKTIKSLDTFYLVKKLEYSCWLLAQNLNRTSEVNLNILDSQESLLYGISDQTLEEEPLVKAYLLAYKLLKDDFSETAFHELQEHLNKSENLIPFAKIKALQTLCRNFLIVSHNRHETKVLLEKAFQLYKEHLKKGYLYYDGGLLPSTIKNLVVKGIRLNEHQWVYDFLQEAKDKIIGTNHPQDVYHFNMAWYYFSRRKFEEALELLSDSYEDVYYKVTAKRLEVMIRYEQQSILTDTRLDAFKIYIFRLGKKSLSKLSKEGNNNFADMMKQITNPKTKNNPARISKLIQKVKDNKVLADKDWILQQLNAMAAGK